MQNRIKFLIAHVILNDRVHAKGDVIDVDEDQFKRLVKVEKAAVETDEELTVFPEPAAIESEPDEPNASPEGGVGGVETAVKAAGKSRR